MTQVHPFRAFKLPGKPVARDTQDTRHVDAALLTAPSSDEPVTLPEAAVPVFGHRDLGGFLVLRHDYDAPSGIRKSRLSLVALLGAVDGSDGAVKPMLDADPREVGSLTAQLERARTQLEPVVGLYDDARLQLDKILETACLSGGQPEFDEQRADGDHLRIWKIEDPLVVGEIEGFFEDRDLYVMDGLSMYRAYRRLNGGASRAGAVGQPLVVLANLCDFGVELTAHHLLVKDLPRVDINELVVRLTPFFHVASFPFSGANDRAAVIKRFDEEFRVLGFTDRAVGAYFSGNAQLFLFRLREDADRELLFLPDVLPAQRNLDAFLLRNVILERYLRCDPADATDGRVRGCARTIEDAVHSVDSGRCSAAFLLNPPTKRQLTEFLREGLRLPLGAVALDPPVPSGLIAHFPLVP